MWLEQEEIMTRVERIIVLQIKATSKVHPYDTVIPAFFEREYACVALRPEC